MGAVWCPIIHDQTESIPAPVTEPFNLESCEQVPESFFRCTISENLKAVHFIPRGSVAMFSIAEVVTYFFPKSS